MVKISIGKSTTFSYFYLFNYFVNKDLNIFFLDMVYCSFPNKSNIFCYFCKTIYLFVFTSLPSLILISLEGLAPYRGQTSSSCGGLVAFGHQMGALWAPWPVKFMFWALRTPPSSSCRQLESFCHLIGDLLNWDQKDYYEKIFGLWPPVRCLSVPLTGKIEVWGTTCPFL